jgi:type I restriction enzyme S subunit
MKCKVTVDTSHYPKEGPWELPKGWVWLSGEDIFLPMESTSPKGEFFEYIDIDAIDNATNCIKKPKHLAVLNAPSRATRKVSKGDVLFSMVRPYLRNIAMVELDSCIASTGFYVCRCSEILDSKYCYYLMLSNYVVEGLNQFMKGDNSPSINNTHITSWIYPIPPLSEQKRISGAIDGLLTYVGNLEGAMSGIVKCIDEVKSKLLDLAIHGKLVPQYPSDEPAIELLKRINPAFKPSDNLHYKDCPKGWIIVKVADVFEINPKIQGDDDADAGFVPMSNIREGFCNKFSFEVKTWGKIKNGFTRFADGDIAVAKISPCLENRKSVIMRDLPNGIGAGTTELNIFRSRVVNPEYGLLFFKSNYFINACAGSYNGVVGQQRVSRSLIEEMYFLLPPVEEQKRIVATINEYFAVINEISYSLQ